MAIATCLYPLHLEFGGRMVEFAGWLLPLHFGSQLKEHQAVRRAVGIFDVSHMAIFDFEGAESLDFLRILLANDVAKSAAGEGIYTCILNPAGGVLDDAVVFRLTDDRFRLVANAATREKLSHWLALQTKGLQVDIMLRDDLAMIAAQGPKARETVLATLPVDLSRAAEALAPFTCAEWRDWFIARTGYTGEDGFEIVLPQADAIAYWRGLIAGGCAPCGLGARDTLRLEAGLRLYGQDMDEAVSPLESGLAWTVAFSPLDRRFIGRAALEAQQAGPALRRFVGLILEQQGIVRQGQRVEVPGIGAGIVTSGSFSPTLDCSIGLARLPPGRYDRCLVDIRGQLKPAIVTTTRFLKLRPESIA